MTKQLDLTPLAPLARVIAETLRETPVRLGTPEGTADLTSMLTVKVAAYLGREVVPDDSQVTGPRTEGLTASECQFLTFALELAADQMALRGDEFDEDDDAALAKLRLIAEPVQAGGPAL
ncbi:hypothetical protein PV518_17795 [Streptomyces sp. ND04-05B]|uniref:hypothetical protein n=1 Tax=Streptomyces sp. ND04-05B TaxID=3028693 RepID=UPI0029AFC769|nr:hypothetical protein [Streptomyces sp. ND04-05B]MDX3064014.1 hypothetical protein [Streptomyces sp. ND04-05B]